MAKFTTLKFVQTVTPNCRFQNVFLAYFCIPPVFQK
jgi:hypothetical protein